MRISLSPVCRGLLPGAPLPLCFLLEGTTNQGVATACTQAAGPERDASLTRAGQARWAADAARRVTVSARARR